MADTASNMERRRAPLSRQSWETGSTPLGDSAPGLMEHPGEEAGNRPDTGAQSALHGEAREVKTDTRTAWN